MPIAALSEVDLDRLEQSKIPDETKKLDHLVPENWRSVVVRSCRYLNNIVEQDHRAIKRRTRPMLGFKTFRCARILLAGIELMHMIAKGQMKCACEIHLSGADQFYDLAT